MSDDSLLNRGAPEPQALHYPWPEAPQAGAATELVPGLWWLRMSLPMQLNHINLYALEDGDGWTVVDTGMKTPEAAQLWANWLQADGPLAGRPVHRVLATHMHPDHVGMAGWLTGKFDAALWMTRGEYLNCRVLLGDTTRAAPEAALNFYRRAGWTPASLDIYRSRFGAFGKFIHAMPEAYRRLQHGDEFSVGAHRWRVVVGSGHSPEHACLYCAELALLISGDQVLPRISSNVSVYPTEPEADPLGDWLASIDLIGREVPDDVLVLPAHEEPFRGLHARLDQLAASHARTLDRLREALAQPMRVVDTFPALFARTITPEGVLLGLATGEALAHLNHLVQAGEVQVSEDPQGVAWFQRRTLTQ